MVHDEPGLSQTDDQIAPPTHADYDHFFLDHQRIIKARSGAYRSQQFVGRGGNGTTFLATGIDGPYVGLQFALKVFHKISNQQRRAAFLGEIEYYKKLDHPAIIRFYDEGVYQIGDRPYPFVIVEYVPKSLQQILIESSRKIDRVTAIRFVLGVTAALKYLHEQQPPLIHRDIKPGNILVSGEKARLADFGLAKSLEEAATDEPALVREEIAYAAMPKFYRTPELVRRARGDKTPLTAASDIYQLGTVLYEVLTGFNPQSPPKDPTDDLTLNLRSIKGECGERLSSMIENMLREIAAERPTAATVLANLLLIHRDYCFRVKDITGQFV